MIEPVHNQLYVHIVHGVEVGALGEILMDQAIGVLVEPSLPGMIGVGKIYLSLQRLADVLMGGKLFTIVDGDRMRVFLLRFQQSDRRGGDWSETRRP